MSMWHFETNLKQFNLPPGNRVQTIIKIIEHDCHLDNRLDKIV